MRRKVAVGLLYRHLVHRILVAHYPAAKLFDARPHAFQSTLEPAQGGEQRVVLARFAIKLRIPGVQERIQIIQVFVCIVLPLAVFNAVITRLFTVRHKNKAQVVRVARSPKRILRIDWTTPQSLGVLVIRGHIHQLFLHGFGGARRVLQKRFCIPLLYLAVCPLRILL